MSEGKTKGVEPTPPLPPRKLLFPSHDSSTASHDIQDNDFPHPFVQRAGTDGNERSRPVTMYDQISESFVHCGNRISYLILPLFQLCLLGTSYVYRSITFAATLASALIVPTIIQLLPYLLGVSIAIIVSRYTYLTIVSNVVTYPLNLACGYGFQYLTWLGPWIGAIDICVRDHSSVHAHSHKRADLIDTASAFNYTKVDESLQEARLVFDEMCATVQNISFAMIGFQGNQEELDLTTAAQSLTSIWDSADSQLQELRGTHGKSLKSLHRDIRSFMGDIQRNNRDLEDAGADSFITNHRLAWVPGLSSPMSQIKHSIVKFANANRQAELKRLTRQAKTFAATVKKMHRMQVDSSRLFGK